MNYMSCAKLHFVPNDASHSARPRASRSQQPVSTFTILSLTSPRASTPFLNAHLMILTPCLAPTASHSPPSDHATAFNSWP